MVADGGPPAPRLLAALVHAGVDVDEVHRRRPRLEDLFTRLTEGDDPRGEWP